MKKRIIAAATFTACLALGRVKKVSQIGLQTRV